MAATAHAGGNGGGDSFPPGGFAPRERIVYDGKRMRKPIVRRSIDPNSSILYEVVNRKYQRDFRDFESINPHSRYRRFLLPPSSYLNNISTNFCTRFCRTSINKQRCPVNCVTWTPEGRRLLTGNSNGEFTLWNGLAFNFETILQAHDDAVRAMIWSHNDNWLVTADHGGVIKYWQSSMTNVQLLQGHREAVRSLSFSPTDFKFVSCSDDATVKIWDFEGAREERTLTGHGWDVKCVAYHPQKSLLASGSKDNLVKIWDPKSGNSLNTLHGHKNTVLKVAWNQNGNWLMTASRDQLIKLYDIRTLREFITMKGHCREVTAISWHPVHETLFASGAFDGSLAYWIVGEETPSVTIKFAHENAIWDIDWHPVGHVVATGSNDHTTKFWCRNRPGDTMDDKYNTGQGFGDGDMTGVETQMSSSAYEPVLPGMAGALNAKSVDAAAVKLTSSFGAKQDRQPGRRPPPDTYTCNRCGTKGHWIEDCPQIAQANTSSSDRKVPPEGYLCNRCNTAGHYISDCTQPRIPPASYTCHKCGEKGHWKQDCTAADGAKDKIGGDRQGGTPRFGQGRQRTLDMHHDDDNKNQSAFHGENGQDSLLPNPAGMHPTQFQQSQQPNQAGSHYQQAPYFHPQQSQSVLGAGGAAMASQGHPNNMPGQYQQHGMRQPPAGMRNAQQHNMYQQPDHRGYQQQQDRGDGWDGNQLIGTKRGSSQISDSDPYNSQQPPFGGRRPGQFSHGQMGGDQGRNNRPQHGRQGGMRRSEASPENPGPLQGQFRQHYQEQYGQPGGNFQPQFEQAQNRMQQPMHAQNQGYDNYGSSGQDNRRGGGGQMASPGGERGRRRDRSGGRGRGRGRGQGQMDMGQGDNRNAWR